VSCGKTADWIRMPFGVVSEIGRGISVLHGGWLSSKGRGSFRVNEGHRIVTNWDFAA